ncbi:MAG: tetratricopeptide repeat protein [Deltaproteobacteria bacterium]|nr:tetratricopeptide repeat protein [Deltaproteobacteria bacterium]
MRSLSLPRVIPSLLVIAATLLNCAPAWSADAAYSESVVLQQYKKAFDLDPNNINVRYQLAVALLREKHYDEAKGHLLKVYESLPNDADVSYYLGIAYASSNEPNKAFEAYGRVELAGIKTAKESYELDKVYYNLGISYQKGESTANALKAYNKSIEIDPEQGLAYCRRGEVQFNLKNYAEAIESFKICEARFPADAQVKQNIAAARLQKGLYLIGEKKYQEAMVEFKKISEADPDNQNAVYFQGFLHYQMSDFKQSLATLLAIKSPESSAVIFQNLPALFQNIGVELQARQDWNNAEVALKKAIEFKKNDADIRYLMGFNHMKKDNYPGAMEELKEALRLNPSHPRATLLLAVVTDKLAEQRVKAGESELMLGNYAVALTQFNSALDIDPKNQRAVKGKRDVEKALETMKGEASARQERELIKKLAEGDNLVKEEKYVEALAVYQFVLALDPANTGALQGVSVAENFIKEGKDKHKRLGDKYSEDKKFFLAFKEYKKALTFDPDDAFVRSNVKSAETELLAIVNPLVDEARRLEEAGDYAGAVKSYSTAAEFDPENKDSIDGRRLASEMLEKKFSENVSGGKKNLDAGDYLKAAEHFKAALKLKPDNQDVKERLARAQKSVDRAIAAKLKAAEKAFKEGNYAAAMEGYEEVLAIDESNLQASDGVGSAKRQLSDEVAKKLGMAEESFHQGKFYQSYMFAGEALAMDKDNREAKTKRNAARQKMDESVAPLLKNAAQEMGKGNTDSAIADYKRVLNIDPSNETAKKHLSGIDKSRVMKSVQSKVKKLYDEGIQLYIDGKYTAAIKNWEQVLELDPGNEKASLNIKKAKKKLEGVMDVK